jgi:hypothetical protein
MRTCGAALLAALITTEGCFAYRPAPLTPEPGSRVRVVFTTAMAVTTNAADGDNSQRVYPGVLEAGGTVQAVGGDTLALRLGELRTAAGPVPGVSGRIALLPTGQIARIEQRRLMAGSTILLAAGVSILALTTLVVLLIVAVTRSAA